MTDYLPVIVALIASPLVAWITVRASRPKVKADATRVLTDVSLSLVEPLQERIVQLEEREDKNELRISFLERENRVLHRWAQILFTQVIEAGGIPVSFEHVQGLEEDQ